MTLRDDDRSANVIEVMSNDKPDHGDKTKCQIGECQRESKAGISLKHNHRNLVL